MKMKKIGGLLLIATLSLAAVAIASGQGKTRTTTKSSTDDSTHVRRSESRWVHTSSDGQIDISIGGKTVQFNDDYTDVERIGSEGYFRVSEVRAGIKRRLEVTPEADGRLNRVYTVGGEVRPFDSDARAWLGKLLSEAVAASGYDAEARVGKILHKSGVKGVLAEIGRLKADYARRVYASALIDQGNLNGEQLARLLSLTSGALNSDYEKATLLIKVLKNNMADNDVRAAFFRMTDTLSSDYERGRVLAVLLKRDDLAPETIMLALKSVAGMSSDFEKANVLIRASKTGAANESVRAAIIEAAHTLGSDYERGRVLTVATKK